MSRNDELLSSTCMHTLMQCWLNVASYIALGIECMHACGYKSACVSTLCTGNNALFVKSGLIDK